MDSTAKRRLPLILLFTSCFAALAFPLYFVSGRVFAYKTIARAIQNGDEATAVQRINWLSGRCFWQADWTIDGALPKWRWVHELNSKLLGCSSCRGNWRTLLQRAAAAGQSTTVDVLLAKGASVSFYGDKGCQALASAVSGGNTKIMATLISQGADLTATNHLGMAVVHMAAAWGSLRSLEFLICAGADVNVMDRRGQASLDWARLYNSNAIPLLLAHGARAETNQQTALVSGNKSSANGGP